MPLDTLLAFALCGMTFLTLKEKLLLQSQLASEEDLSGVDSDGVARMIGRPLRNSVWNGADALAEARRVRQLCAAYGIRFAHYASAAYPALLRESFNPPYMLFYRGDISALQKKCVSMVGTRRMCRPCAEAAFAFAKEAALHGQCVVSGLALGIDACAHKGALDAARDMSLSGTTAAVLPCGADCVVPSAHKALAKAVLDTGGCILSEYLPGTPPVHFRYVQRNRIIAALSSCTVVVQAPPASGALITADFAVQENRILCFHESAFGPEARRDSEAKRLSLASDKKKERKLKITAENFVSEGAAVIKTYSDYCHFF